MCYKRTERCSSVGRRTVRREAGMRLLCLVLATCCLGRAAAQSSSSSCSGAFDFIFVIDRSLSLADHYTESVVPFVEGVANNFINPDFRLSFITFDRNATLHLPLTPTENREAIMAGIQSMLNVEHNSGTDLPIAIDVATAQITSNPSDSVKVILALTDGMWRGTLFRRVQRLKQLGVLRYIVGIGNVDREQFNEFVDSSDNVFIGADFLHLQQIIDMVIERTCVEVTSIDPSKLCVDRNASDLRLRGRGFTLHLNRNRAACRFRTDAGFIITQPVGEITKYNMTCEDPGINKTGEYELGVTLDGVSYVTSSVKLVVDDCKPGGGGDGGEDGGGGGGGGGEGGRDGGGGGGGGEVNVALAVGLLFAIIGLILLILLCCLWIFLPIITCRIVGGLPPEPEEEKPPEPKPGRKWEVVDASYYGGGGVGGIKPVTVRWGKGGSTEQGNKLTKAKDAEVVEVVHEPGVPAPPPKAPPGCWERFKKKVRRMYAVASSYRPVWGPTKRILWFPGTKPETSQPTPSQKPATARHSKPTPAPLRAGSSSAFLLPENGSVSSPVRSPPPPPPSSTPSRARPPPPPRPPSLNKPPVPSRPAPRSGNS